MSEDTKKEYLVTFDGDEDKWPEWSLKVEAIGTKKGWWKEVLNPDPIDPKSNNKEMQERVRNNAEAWLYFLLTCKGKTTMNYIAEAENKSAYQAWQNLKKRFDGANKTNLLNSIC